MFKVPDTRHRHGYLGFFGGFNHVGVGNGTARLNDHVNPCLRRQLHIVNVRQEGIRDENGTLRIFTGFLDSDTDAFNAACLPATDPDCPTAFDKNDGI